jgi:isopentenyl diphosphate isomerase/L-lactate dehydrogenase-like FMN-dependent dehydrogenase
MNRDQLQRFGYSVHALRQEARKRLPRMLFDMVDGAAGDEITVRRNESDIADLEVVPKVLTGAPTRNQSVEIFGHRLPSPVIIGPTGLAGLLWPHAELCTARAAHRFGTIYTTSHASTSTIEEIGAATDGPKWMQVFLYTDRALTAEFIARAQQAGYAGLVLTVDNQVMAVRDRDARNGLMFPMKLRTRGLIDLASHPGWLLRMRKAPNPTFVNYDKFTSIGTFGPVMQKLLDPGASWKDVEWVRGLWKGPMILKGILHPDEARQAEALGIDAIVVSNHGGRQYDSAISGIRALAPIVDAVGGKTVVLVDGGFRRGADIVKALALGARAVLIGRPQLWGVACAGEDGVSWVLELLKREIDRALALGSWDDIRQLDRSIFFNSSPWT